MSSLASSQAIGPKPLQDFSKEALVIEHYVTTVRFQADGSSTRQISAVVRVQAEAGVQALAVLRFQYSTEDEAVEVDYVRVRKPDGTVVTTPAYNIQDMPAEVTRDAPMYSDIHEKHVMVKALGVGDILEYVVRYRTLKPEIPDQFWLEYSFSKAEITKDEQLQVTVPRDKYVNVSSPDLKPEIKDDGSTRTYLWKTSNLVHEDKSHELPKRYAPPPSVQITTFRSWSEIGAWYAGLQKTQLSLTPAIQAKAADVTKGLTSDEARIRALYDFVSTHVHYISLSFGIGRYQPHAADEVLGNEYGDCKDKHTLLAALLKAAGYDAWPALVNTSRKIDADIPSPAQFDHVITVIPRGDQFWWLDTTPEVTPFRLLMGNLRDKQALVIPDNKPASLQTTPANPPFPSSWDVTAQGRLDSSGVLHAHMHRVAHGDAEVFLRLGFRRVPPAQWQDLVQRISYATGFGGEVSNVTASAPDDLSKPFEYSYDYVRKDYSDWANRRIGPPMPPLGIEVSARDEDKKPTEPFFLGATGELTYQARVELPPGSKPSLPNSVNLLEDFAEYHASYKLEGRVWVVERRLIIKKAEVPLASWEKYRKFRKAVTDDENVFMDLNLPGQGTAPTTTSSTSPADQELADLFKNGIAAMQDRDLTTAEEAFRKIIARNPKFPNAHGNLGAIDFMHNRIDDGIRELLQEEDISPTNPQWFSALALVYAQTGRLDEAMSQWRKLLDFDPKNRDAANSLGRALLARKRYAEAVQVLESATAQSPDSPALLLTLGQAYLRTKELDKGASALKKAVELDSSDLMLNNAAYGASEAGVLLDLSKQWSESAVSKLETATANTSLTALKIEDLQHVSLLIGYWDTLGWTYYQLRNFPSAEKYLHAAWVLGQYAVVADHLGQVYEKEGKRTQAARMYELALAGLGSGAEAAEHYHKLTGKEATSGTIPSQFRGTRFLPPMWAADEVSRMRTVRVPVTTKESGTAEFFVLISAGPKVEDVRFISGSENLKSIASRLKSIKFPIEFPDDGPTRIARRGVLVCGEVGCNFTLLLPDDVRSLE